VISHLKGSNHLNPVRFGEADLQTPRPGVLVQIGFDWRGPVRVYCHNAVSSRFHVSVGSLVGAEDGTGVPSFVTKHACGSNKTITILDLINLGTI